MNKKLIFLISTLLMFLVFSCEKSMEEEIPRSGAKELTKVTFLKSSNPQLDSDIEAVKSGSGYTVNFPQGSDLRNLSLNLTVSKGSKVIVKGESFESYEGEVILNGDFSQKMEITVEAEDGTQAKYTLTVISAPFSSEKIISSFIIRAEDNQSIGNDIQGTISGNTIRFTVPSGTYARLYAQVEMSEFAKIFDMNGKVVPEDKLFEFYSVDQSTGKEEKFKIKIQAQDKSVQEYEVSITTEKGNPNDIFEHSSASRLSSIFFKTGDDAELFYYSDPIFASFQYNALGKIEKIRYYLHLTLDNGYKYFTYVGMDEYTYSPSTVEIRKLSVFYEGQDHGRLIAELGTNGYPKNLKYTFSANGNTFFANYQYNSNGNLIRETGKGYMFDAGSVFEDLTKVPFDESHIYKDGNRIKSGNLEFSYYKDKVTNDNWAQGLVALGTSARTGEYSVKMGKPSKNLLKQVHNTYYDDYIDYTYKFDTKNRVSEMRMTSTANDHWGTPEKPAIIEFNYPK